MAKPFARQFYSSKAWQTCRNEYYKKARGLCENCLRQGIITPGVIVHHKIELTPANIENPEIALNFNNLELLCRRCHDEEHDREGGRWGAVNKRKREQKKASLRYMIGANGEVLPKGSPL